MLSRKRSSITLPSKGRPSHLGMGKFGIVQSNFSGLLPLNRTPPDVLAYYKLRRSYISTSKT